MDTPDQQPIGTAPYQKKQLRRITIKKKILACVLLIVFAIAAFAPSALAAPTNSNYWNRCFVYGGPSQQICTLSSTDATYYRVSVSAISLNGEEHISFRPYGSEGVLCSTTLEVSGTGSYNKTYNRGNVYIGKMVTMKASIPSSNDEDYATFRGYVYI